MILVGEWTGQALRRHHRKITVYISQATLRSRPWDSAALTVTPPGQWSRQSYPFATVQDGSDVIESSGHRIPP